MRPLASCAVTAAPRQVASPHVCRSRLSGRCHAVASQCSLPHAHSDHVPVALANRDVMLTCGAAVRLVLPEDPYAVEALHRLEGDGHTADAVWSEVWPSAFACADELLCGSLLADRLRQQPVRRVCELGAGVGLAGLAAALAWRTASVLLTDREPRALWCALASAQANGLRVDPSGLPPSLPPLPAAAADATPDGPCVSAALLDWDAPLHPSMVGAFDVLLLCDVLYQPGSIALLAEVVPQLLSPNGIILLADTAHRPGKEGLRHQFLDGVAGAAAGGRVMRVQAIHSLVAHMPAPALDVNTGDTHAVELVVLSA
jgi:predicted nicotinamide N-methyase